MRPVRIIVGFAAGGVTDIIARLLAQSLSDRLGAQFAVENRPGASTNLATELVVRAPADGYTLLLIGPPAAINVTLYDNLNFNFVHDIAPVAAIVRAPFVVVVDPSFPARTMADFITYAKANSGMAPRCVRDKCGFSARAVLREARPTFVGGSRNAAEMRLRCPRCGSRTVRAQRVFGRDSISRNRQPISRAIGRRRGCARAADQFSPNPIGT